MLCDLCTGFFKKYKRFSYVFLRQTKDDDGADIKGALGVDKRRTFLYYSY